MKKIIDKYIKESIEKNYTLRLMDEINNMPWRDENPYTPKPMRSYLVKKYKNSLFLKKATGSDLDVFAETVEIFKSEDEMKIIKLDECDMRTVKTEDESTITYLEPGGVIKTKDYTPDSPRFKVGDRVKHPSIVEPCILTRVHMANNKVMATAEGGNGMPLKLSKLDIKLIEDEKHTSVADISQNIKIDGKEFQPVWSSKDWPFKPDTEYISTCHRDPQMDDAIWCINGVVTIDDDQDHVEPTEDNPFPTLREFLS